MEWAVWKPLYEEILSDFNFDPSADIESAKILAKIVNTEQIPDYDTISKLLGRQALICGAGTSLEDDLDQLTEDVTIISAGSATERLMRRDIVPDVLVTDLDGDIGSQIEANARGSLAFIHAHGDNRALISNIVPQLPGRIVPTVQCKPFGPLYNFGGFTDGDRAYLITRHFGVNEVRFIGWDLKNPFPKPGMDLDIKSKKLEWAKRLIGSA